MWRTLAQEWRLATVILSEAKNLLRILGERRTLARDSSRLLALSNDGMSASSIANTLLTPSFQASPRTVRGQAATNAARGRREESVAFTRSFAYGCTNRTGTRRIPHFVRTDNVPGFPLSCHCSYIRQAESG